MTGSGEAYVFADGSYVEETLKAGSSSGAAEESEAEDDDGYAVSNGTVTVAQFPHLVIVPAVPLLLTLVGFTMLGDGLRDVLDPRLRH